MVNISDRAAIMSVALGFMGSQALYVAARLELADRLAEGPARTVELAAESDADPQTMGRLLRALVACGVLTQDSPDEFGLTPMGHGLREGVPNSVRNFILLYCSPAVWQAFGELEGTVRTGRTAFETVHGMGAFAYCGSHPDVAAVFHRAMAEDASQVAAHVAEAYDFSGLRTVADIGGGNGTLIAEVLSRATHLHGILFDTEQGVATAPGVLADADVASRCTVVAGDFFASVPAADAYLLKSTVHDWSDADAARILATCCQAMTQGSRLLLIERVLPSTIAPSAGAHGVRHQLAGPVIMGGHERTAAEFQKLLGQVGLELVQISEPLGETGYHIIEGRLA